ncbi:MAG: hypothetical protein FD120_2829, partial [Gammaproteobacteria bacterium]
NPVGTTLEISTGNFAAGSSSSGAVTTLVISNLIANTAYTINARSVNYSTSASNSVLAAATATYANVPPAFTVLTPADVFLSSVTVSWGANGNPLTPPTSYQVQASTDLNFGVYSGSETFALSVTTATLSANTSYYFRARAYNRGGGQSAYNTVIATYTLSNSPAAIAYSVYNTSISVTLGSNNNPAGTTISITTGSFESSASSAGVQSGNTTLNLTNLIPNTVYTVKARALNYNNIASSQTTVVTTTTLTNSIVVNGFNVYTTSVNILIGSNGNPDGTQVMVSTGVGGHYDVARTSVGRTSGNQTSLTIFNLSTNTFYGLQAGNLTTGGSTNTAVVTNSTYTLSVSPGVTSFVMYNTSASVSLDLNTNPVGTTLEISTGNFAAGSSS